MSIEAVLFGLDGTLTSFNLDYQSLRTQTRGFLVNSSVPASALSMEESIFKMLQKGDNFFRNTGKPQNSFEQVCNQGYSIAKIHEIKAAKSTTLLLGVVDTLEGLKRKK